jgi:hypothetical protein
MQTSNRSAVILCNTEKVVCFDGFDSQSFHLFNLTLTALLVISPDIDSYIYPAGIRSFLFIVERLVGL